MIFASQVTIVVPGMSVSAASDDDERCRAVPPGLGIVTSCDMRCLAKASSERHQSVVTTPGDP